MFDGYCIVFCFGCWNEFMCCVEILGCYLEVVIEEIIVLFGCIWYLIVVVIDLLKFDLVLCCVGCCVELN